MFLEFNLSYAGPAHIHIMTEITKMSIDPKFVELTAIVGTIIFIT